MAFRRFQGSITGAALLFGVHCVTTVCCSARVASAARQQDQEGESHPNIVLIMADDVGSEVLGCYGGTSTAVAGKWQLALQKNNPSHPAQLGFDESAVFGWHEGPRYHNPLIYRNGVIWEEKRRPDDNGSPTKYLTGVERSGGKIVRHHKPEISMQDDKAVAGGKGSMTDAGTRVPLLANWPGVTLSGHTCNDLIDFSDFLPTLADLANAPLPSDVALDGRSFAPQLKGESGNPRPWVFCEHAGTRWVRNHRWKLYDDGRLIDNQRDPQEKGPIEPEDESRQAALAREISETAFESLDPAPAVGFLIKPGEVVLTVSGKPVATYVYSDEQIRRPYFAHVKSPGGIQVTRNHPPIAGTDRQDHATMHPGIWMAFGDLDGEDFWRNKGRVFHEEFAAEPTGGAGKGSFAVRNRYERVDGELVCREECHVTLLVRPEGYLLLWDSSFFADRAFYFGDQEEMGLAFRVTTPITVDNGGVMRDSQGRKNGDGIWGKTARWCDYSGTVDERRIGMTLMCHPENFRPSWMHARDYGFIAANPFGRKAFTKGEPSKVVITPGKKLRLRYGILIRDEPQDASPNLAAAYEDYLKRGRAD